jgi:hypothetical protein
VDRANVSHLKPAYNAAVNAHARIQTGARANMPQAAAGSRSAGSHAVRCKVRDGWAVLVSAVVMFLCFLAGPLPNRKISAAATTPQRTSTFSPKAFARKSFP